MKAILIAITLCFLAVPASATKGDLMVFGEESWEYPAGAMIENTSNSTVFASRNYNGTIYDVHQFNATPGDTGITDFSLYLPSSFNASTIKFKAQYASNSSGKLTGTAEWCIRGRYLGNGTDLYAAAGWSDWLCVEDDSGGSGDIPFFTTEASGYLTISALAALDDDASTGVLHFQATRNGTGHDSANNDGLDLYRVILQALRTGLETVFGE